MAKSDAERSKAYRKRKKANRPSKKVSKPKKVPKTKSEKNKTAYQNRKLKRLLPPTDNEDNEPSISRGKRLKFDKYALADVEFNRLFIENPFGFPCDVCHRLWFKSNLSDVLPFLNLLKLEFPEEDVATFKVCRSCKTALNQNQIPQLSRSNGFKYPEFPTHLPKLDCISERLVSPRLPFSQIRCLSYGAIAGQVINVPDDDDAMVAQLPRFLDQDKTLNVNVKGHFVYKSSYLQRFVNADTVQQWLEYLLETPLYRNIAINDNFFSLLSNGNLDIEDNEAAQRQILMWNEDKYLCPGRRVSYDKHAEELSFPAIYLGHPREFKTKVTSFTMADSEIRRADRRGATPTHVLYMAMKLMRLRALLPSFKCITETSQITKEMVKDPEFIKDCVEKDLLFMKTIPNTARYWNLKKKDLLAMIRQLGKPTLLLTLNFSEAKQPGLLKLLYRLRYGCEPEGELTSLQQQQLVNEDPVVCAIYFNKLVNVILRILKSSTDSPFGKYHVLDYYKRIEFRENVHAHLMLWLNNDPREPIDEDMPQTIEMINQLCSLEEDSNQIHKHTRFCYDNNNNQKRCRFGAPFWPMDETRILFPINDKSKVSKYDAMKKDLETATSDDSLKRFLIRHGIESMEEYLEILRAGIHRPSVFLKRATNQTWINDFNPWISKILRSNTNVQFIFDEYSCVENVFAADNNKINRLSRELIEIQDCAEILEGTVEMSPQEAAWYLLGQAMAESSRKIVYIPTFWPHERKKTRKTNKQLEELDGDSLDIWKEDLFQKYEKRPKNLEETSLAQFVAHYKVNTYSRQPTPNVIRYRRYDMSRDVVNYKREMVTLYIPFRNEKTDILDGNRFLEIYDENEEMILNSRREFESNIEDYSNQEDEEFIEHLQNQITINDVRNQQDLTLDLMSTQCDKALSVVRKRENSLSNEEYCERMRQANSEQKELILEAIYRILNGGSEPLQIFFTGPAGSGKTFTIKLLMETYNTFTEGCSEYNAYVACASTGIAATHIGGTTIHSAFKIPISRQDYRLPIENLSAYRNAFRDVIAIIIDEVSMTSADQIQIINSRLQQITGEFNRPYGGLNIIFCGDLCQLSPVMAIPIYKRPKYSLNGEALWQRLEYYSLKQVMRQSDETFSSILTKIGNGDPLSQEEIKIIESRFFTNEEVEEKAPNAIRLFLKNVSVSRYNSKAFANFVIKIRADDTFIGHKTDKQCTSMGTELNKMSMSDTGGLPHTIRLSVGKPYMLTVNIDVEDGLVNGVIGHLRHIEKDEYDGFEVLWFEFPEQKIGSIARMKHKAKMEKKKNNNNNVLKSNWTPIFKKSFTVTFRDKTLKCKRNQFPVVEACALTVHKSQGSTFDQVVFEYEKTHDQQLVYVALSRVTSLEGLFLTNPNNDRKFYHIGGGKASLRQELERLKKHRLSTVSKECKDFLELPSVTDLSLLAFNVRGLERYLEDLENDDVLSKTNIMAITETWLDNGRKVDIKGYRCITQFKGEAGGGVAIYEKLDSLMFSTPHQFREREEEEEENNKMDVCAVEITINGQRVLIVLVCLPPDERMENIKHFFAKLFQTYAWKDKKCSKYIDMPVILITDFKWNSRKEEGRLFVRYLKESFGLDLVSDPEISTTREKICLLFTLNMKKQVHVKNFVSYFGNQQPVLCITKD